MTISPSLNHLPPTSFSFTHQSFTFTTIAEFLWTVQLSTCHHQIFKASSATIAHTNFSLRHFRLVPPPSPPTPITLNTETNDLDFQDDTNTQRNSKQTHSAHTQPTNTQPATHIQSAPFSLAEVILSRAIELEAQERSSSCWSSRPQLRNDFMVEATPPSADGESLDKNVVQERLPVCILRPASCGETEDTDKVNICVKNITPEEVNELRWLLATVDLLESASLFTRLVEQRNVREFHILHQSDLGFEQLSGMKAIRLAEPWTCAWKWLSSCGLDINEVIGVYLNAVGLTWAPVPENMEASWLYEIEVFGQERIVPKDGQIILDVESVSNQEQFISVSVKKYFEGFLWDIIAFWRGISPPYDIKKTIAWNTDQAARGAFELKRIASRYSEKLWVIGDVPVAALVKGAWEEVDWKRSNLPYCPTDITVALPLRLSTLVFKAEADGDANVTERMFVNGYSPVPLDDRHFRLGISSAGLFLSNNLFVPDLHDRNSRQKNVWLFDIEKGFILDGAHLGILFLATRGANIKASYDEGFARMFSGPYPFAAVAEWPRCCFVTADPTHQHQLIIERANPADRRGRGVFEILEAIRRYGGILHLMCEYAPAILVSSSQPSAVLMRLHKQAASSNAISRMRSASPLKGRIGILHCEKLIPGIYTSDTLIIPNDCSPREAASIKFCKALMRDLEELEVCVMDRSLQHRNLNETEFDPIVLAHGSSYYSCNFNTFKPRTSAGNSSSRQYNRSV